MSCALALNISSGVGFPAAQGLVHGELLAGLGAVAAAVACVACGLLWGRWRRVRRQGEALRDELRLAQQALRAAEGRTEALARRLDDAQRLAAVGAMSAQIAHQLRNPLTSSGLYVQLLGDELRALASRDGGEAAELLARVQHELATMVEITDNYLQYARLPEMVLGPLEVNQAVRELLKLVRHEAERRGIAVTALLCEGRLMVDADRRLLGHAVMNLLRNALEAMGPGGRLRVKTCQENGVVEVHVSDTGPGVPESDLERLFEPFYTTKETGSGLGLCLSRQIVERHHGSLACQSLVGVGTTFIVRLPARAGEERTNDGLVERSDGAGRG